MERWRDNVRALAYNNKELADEMERMILQNKIRDVHVKKLDNDKKVLTVTREDHIWHLNSRLDPEGAAGLYADRYTIKPFYRYFIFGISDGRAIHKLLEKCDESNALIICEPNKEIMAETIYQYDLKELFLDDRVCICVFDMWEELCRAVISTVEYSYIKLVEFCILPGYDVLYPEECEKFIDEVIEKIRTEIINADTNEYFGRAVPQNKLFHMRHMITQRNVGQIKNEIGEEKIEDVPAIIIAAGPSLDKNIKEIKKAEGKAFIFVVDAALQTVVREGIRPDLVCTTDAKAPERFFEIDESERFLWVCSCWANSCVAKKYMKKIFYYNAVNLSWNEALQKELDIEFPQIVSGGCVSAEAFQIACYLGFRTIIFVGQDLAFTGGQSHTSGIKGVLGNNDDYIKERYLVEVEDFEGNLITTDFQMDYYRKWFEKKIKILGDKVKVIDATEGGARIEGAIILSLKEAIEQECRQKIDFHKILENIPPAFDIEKQKRLFLKIEAMKEWKKDFKKLLDEGISLERELQEKIEFLTNQEIAIYLRKISVQNERIERHPFCKWLAMYAGDEEIEMKKHILTEENMGVREIMERSICLLQSYQDSIPLFEQDLKDVLIES